MGASLPAIISREQDAPTTFKNYGSQNRCGLVSIVVGQWGIYTYLSSNIKKFDKLNIQGKSGVKITQE
ncbi:MAG: hypothetical protein V7K50_23595 [Nostoc sp.]|uniref:hypothetical protein n=1 Tax=Nostoc sp. TaxID=1180 RepID=UPI002FF4D978